MLWALRRNDPEGWLNVPQSAHDLITEADGPFKTSLDAYKYASRAETPDPENHRTDASQFLMTLNAMLDDQRFLYGPTPRLPDMAIAPFIRQFAHVDLDWFNAQALAEPRPMVKRFQSLRAVRQRHGKISGLEPGHRPDRGLKTLKNRLQKL